MAVSYKRLWKLLVDKKMSKSDLCKRGSMGRFIIGKKTSYFV